jgi:aspartyl-tRNA(Asn)/glutamyl-tRNA(Gln) amidotransferase subunit A
VVGIKATAGAVPTDGIVSLSWTMDHLGPLAATVGDAARMLDVLRGPGHHPRLADVADEAGDSPAIPFVGGQRLRIGIPDAGLEGGDDDVVAAVERAVTLVVALGAQRVEVGRPSRADFDDANAAGLVISRTEAATAHRSIGTDLDRCWPETADQLRAAADVSAVEYLEAQRRRGQLADELLAELIGQPANVDVLALPTTLVTAPLVEDAADYLMVLSRNAIPFSLVGFPALSVPCGRDRHGLPIGLQLVAAPHHEARLVAVAARLEATLAAS